VRPGPGFWHLIVVNGESLIDGDPASTIAIGWIVARRLRRSR